MAEIHVEPIIGSYSGEESATVASSVGNPISHLGNSSYSSPAPLWAHWISLAILVLTFVIGLPLNGATVLIFWRRKKLRHLVNFVLLLDCLSHIVLCLFTIPLHLVTEWSDSSEILAKVPSSLGIDDLSGVNSFQHVVCNFVNLYSTFLTVSIAILRCRRLCWKKKDKFSTMNALKWSVTSAVLAVSITIIQFYVVLTPANRNVIAAVYLGKIFLILSAVVTVIFCYVRVSQKVWANTANQEKTMDPAKLKKSRNVHLKATIHSCIQIVLIIATTIPHFYLQTLEMLTASGYYTNGPGIVFQARKDLKGSHPLSSNNVDMSLADVVSTDDILASKQNIFNALPYRKQFQHHSTQQDINGGSDGGWQDKSLLSDSPQKYSSYHHESLSSKTSFLHSTLEIVRFANITSDTYGDDNNEDGGEGESADGISASIAATAAAAITFTFGASQLAKLIAVTVNYALLALGTPFAYIASCHRFREQFTSILFSHAPNSPQNSTYHHGHHNHSSFSHKAHRERFHYHHRSTTGGTQDACFSSPLTRVDTRTSTTMVQNHSSMMVRGNSRGTSCGELAGARESISMSGNTRSSFSHSFKSRSSLRKSSVGGSIKRRKSSSSGPCGIGIIGDSCGGHSSLGCGKGLGVSMAADSVFMGSDSALILEQDTSNGSSSTGNLDKPTPSPTEEHDDANSSGRGSSGALVAGHNSSGSSSSSQQNFPCHHITATTMTTLANSNSSNLNTYLQPFGLYGYKTDFGQPV